MQLHTIDIISTRRSSATLLLRRAIKKWIGLIASNGCIIMMKTLPQLKSEEWRASGRFLGST